MSKTQPKVATKEHEKPESQRQEQKAFIPYLRSDELYARLSVVPVDDLISIDSYNETAILNKVLSYSLDEQKILYQISLQVAIIGVGNRNYGKIKINGEVIDMITIIKKMQLSYHKNQNALYKEDELSPRRLTRLFRAHISDYIQKMRRPSYLWFKYSDKDQKYAPICFPGGEYLDLTREEYKYLYELYSNVDERLNTTFKVRIERIALARGISLQ